MKFYIFILLASSLISQELKVKANSFYTDQKTGISVFEGEVNIIKENDELNASEVTIYTDKDNKPTKFVAKGDASFRITTKEGSLYKGKAQKVVYFPKTKEYRFFTDVYLSQVDEKKEIIGNEVVLKTIEGKAHAIGAKSEPVIMIFDMPKEKKDEKND
ncbi:lipopolysaccharide transport periplasmic protein LptA [Sulfurimonas sp.]